MIDFSDLRIEEVENDGKKAIFKIGPLPRGYGHTVANSLRRILLSSLTGAGVTSLKVSGVDHEYSTIKGVKENVVEIMMNLKGVRFKCESDEPQVVSLSVKGNKDVSAGDLDLTESVQVMNPDTHIAALTDKSASLEFEMVVERGIGYRAGDEEVRSEAGRLPMDADFSPVERVMFSVDETRKGEKMNLDMITMTVFTDGSIDPKEALGSAANVMRDVSDQLITLTGLVIEGKSGAKSDAGSVAVPAGTEDIKEIAVEDLPVSKRTKSSLMSSGLKNLGDIAKTSSKELMDIPGFGKKALEEVVELAKGYGLTIE